jgi:NAD(P)-dependent dehydrogenase (short-subunit alcohol dehydrogenase family)
MTVEPAATQPAASTASARLPAPSRRVIILGALSAIAQAVARTYASEGAAILLVARNNDRLSAVAADLLARGAARVELAALDLDAESANAASHLAAWTNRLGGLDHVHLVYGYLGSQETASKDQAELQRILSVNFTSAALWCEAVANRLREQKSGSLVVITSVAGDRGRQSNYAYGAAKGGLSLFVQGLAHSLAAHRARAVSVKLGFVDTPMTEGLAKGGPLWATPDRVAPMIRRAADTGGPIQYGPWFWRYVMLVIRSVPSFVFHRTKL